MAGGAAFDAWVRWLVETHAGDVLAAGAEHAEVVVLDPVGEAERSVEVRYRFASRAAFEGYERDHAPRLRAEGLGELARLGHVGGAGVTFARTTGDIRRVRA